MIALHSIQKDYSGTKAIFEIELENRENVYMSISRTNYMNEERCVVIVDAKKFLNLWRNEPNSMHSNISMGNARAWKNDYKFHHAEIGFSGGVNNPVPLAEIECQQHVVKKAIYRRKYLVFKELIKIEKSTLDYVAFTNGITRTIWLLVHGARYFPVKCGTCESAKRLAQIAGYSGVNCKSVDQITKNAEA